MADSKKIKQIIVHVIFSIIILIHILLSIAWLSIFTIIIWIAYWLYSSQNRFISKIRSKTIISFPIGLIAAMLLAITLKTLFFGINYVPSESMTNTIKPYDILYANPLIYGPRLPSSPYEISWIGVGLWLINGKDVDIEKEWWKYKRLKGYSSPKRNDITTFNHPGDKSIYIKRIVALPGDTLQIIDSDIYINGKKSDSPKNARFYSQVIFNNRQNAYKIINEMNINLWNNNHKIDKFNGFLTKEELKKLQNSNEVQLATIEPEREDTAWLVYPKKEELKWNIDNYGPFILPKKGDEIELTEQNILIYDKLIAQESADIDTLNNNYKFAHNYYFMIGDNFHDSEDSRYFGPIKEEQIIAKNTMLIFSKREKFKRFWKRL